MRVKDQNRSQHPVAEALLRLSQIMESARLASAVAVGLSSLQVQILELLAPRQIDAPISYFARRFGVSMATVSDSVRVLESKGCVAKTRSPVDARSVGVAITNRGREAVGVASHWTDSLQTLVADWDSRDASKIYTRLLDLIVGLQKSGSSVPDRVCVGCRHLAINCDVGESAAPHYCRALGVRMHPLELRLDCPEFSALE